MSDGVCWKWGRLMPPSGRRELEPGQHEPSSHRAFLYSYKDGEPIEKAYLCERCGLVFVPGDDDE